MRSIIIILFATICFAVNAQGQKPIVYYYTAASERYFSDWEMDSVFYATTADVFKEHDVSGFVLDKKYPQLKPTLVALSRKDIVQSFKWIESTGENTIKAAKGTAAFEGNKTLYTRE